MSDILKRPQDVAFRPERVDIPVPATPAPDWIVRDISCVSLINEDLLASCYADRRKAGRKIRQQRRKLRRINAEFGHRPGEGVPESILRARIILR